jgi:hypothetical protein
MTAEHIGLIVTGEETLKDFRIFCATLQQWNPNAILYVATDSFTPVKSVGWKGTMHVRTTLDEYKGLNRSLMEAMGGKEYENLWTDFMYEKANVMEWMFSAGAPSAWFLDADITFLAPLPTIPETAKLALSPHYIKPGDEARFGHYNGGFLWMRDPKYLAPWRHAGHTSRFYEQAALEAIGAAAHSAGELYEFPPQVNFGWWRMYQSVEPPSKLMTKFTIFRPDNSIGIRYDNQPLQSVHTHWHDASGGAATQFNNFLVMFMRRFSSAHKPLQQFMRALHAK